jgi:hypothetical protein
MALPNGDPTAPRKEEAAKLAKADPAEKGT